MGVLYEIAATPYVFAKKHFGGGTCVGMAGPEQRVPYGAHRQQRFSCWEPERVAHREVVLYFHGGGFVFGESESMADAADVYNAKGYRYCSIGFREWPNARFPGQLQDAFAGVKAAVAWLEGRGVDCSRIVMGGTSAGGMLAYLLCYSRRLQREYAFEDIACRIVGCVSIAGVSRARDLLLKPFPGYLAWRTAVSVPCDGRRRADMLRALDPYCPLHEVGSCRVGHGADAASEAHAVRGGEVPAVSSADVGFTPFPAAAAGAESVVPHQPTPTPAFIMHGRADTLAPFPSQVEFVEKLRACIGDGNVTFRVLDSWKWQHMFLTVSLHKRNPETFAPLRELFEWLAALDA